MGVVAHSSVVTAHWLILTSIRSAIIYLVGPCRGTTIAWKYGLPASDQNETKQHGRFARPNNDMQLPSARRAREAKQAHVSPAVSYSRAVSTVGTGAVSSIHPLALVRRGPTGAPP